MTEIKEGSRVTWTHVTKRGKGYQMTTRKGRVESINGNVVVVRYRQKPFLKSLGELRLEGEKTALTDFVAGLAEACA